MSLIASVAYLFAELVFTWTSLFIKKWRASGLDTKTSVAVIGFHMPIWLVASLVYINWHDLTVPPVYWLFVIPWVITTYIANFGLAFVFKYLSLSSTNALFFSMALLMSLAVDVLIFSFTPAWFALLGVGLILMGGYYLHRLEKKNIDLTEPLSLPFYKVAGIAFAVACVTVINTALYKQGVLVIDDFILHGMITASCGGTLYLVLGGRGAAKAVRDGQIRMREVLLLMALLAVATLAESFAYMHLSLTLIFAIGQVMKTVIFAGNDFKRGDILPHKLSAFFLVMIICGIALTHWGMQ